jgi:hypothetical protein
MDFQITKKVDLMVKDLNINTLDTKFKQSNNRLSKSKPKFVTKVVDYSKMKKVRVYEINGKPVINPTWVYQAI